MSPSGKAPDFDSGIRRFESCHPSHVGRRLLHSASAVSLSAAKAPYPQPPSSLSPRDPLRWARAGAQRERTEYDPLAQSVEQLPFKQWVRGSNPRRVTNKKTAARLFFCWNDVFRCAERDVSFGRDVRSARDVCLWQVILNSHRNL